MLYLFLCLLGFGFVLTSIDIYKFFYQKEQQLTQSQKKAVWGKILFFLLLSVSFISLALSVLLQDNNLSFSLFECFNISFILLMLFIFFMDIRLMVKDKSYKSAIKYLSLLDYLLLALLLVSTIEAICFFPLVSGDFISFFGVNLFGFFAIFLKHFKKNIVFAPQSPRQKKLRFFTDFPREVFYCTACLSVLLGIANIGLMFITAASSSERSFYAIGSQYPACPDGEDCFVSQESCLKKGYIWHAEKKLCELSPNSPIKSKQ